MLRTLLPLMLVSAAIMASPAMASPAAATVRAIPAPATMASPAAATAGAVPSRPAMASPAPATTAVRHVRLEASSPAEGDTLDGSPGVVRLRFSGYIERNYTSLSMTAPDGSAVALGGLNWIEGSNREFTASMPPVTVPGPYTLNWRTAGADGHILTGTITFFIRGDLQAPDSDPAAIGDSAAADAPPGAPPAPADPHGHDHGIGEHDATAPIEVFARLLHFLALTLLLGGYALRAAVVPRIGRAPRAALGRDPDLATPDLPHGTAVIRAQVARLAWRGAAAGALLLAAAAVLRLYLQSAAMHGPERATSIPLLSIMLSDTLWGRGWLLQVVGFALFGAAVSLARPGRDRVALILAAPGALLLAMIPSLTGHAAGAGDGWQIAVVVDTLHVLGVGAWIGGLMLIMYAIVPWFRRRNVQPAAARAGIIDAFSPVALVCGIIVLATGVLNALMHISTPAQLTGTGYGRTLLVKLAFVGAVVVAAFINWRIVRPRLAGDGARRLPLVAGMELLFAFLALFATAVLTGVARP